MTLSDQIKLIDDLVKENPDTTIRQYLDTVAEIENIENKTTMPHPGITAEEKEKILTLAAFMTARDIRQQTNLAFSTIYRVLKEAAIDVKAISRQRRLAAQEQEKKLLEMEASEREQVLELRRIAARKLAENKPKPLIRPVAQYSNHSPWGIATQALNGQL